MNKNSILFLGIGQAGNNMVSEILKTDTRYNGLFINTTYDDLRSIKNAKNNYIVPSAQGTGKNRDLAKTYVKDYICSIIDKINEFPMQKILYVIFSMGGGTGSGISPVLIKVLEKIRPDLIVNLVPILPFDTDSRKSLENTIECWNDIVSLKENHSILMIDNNKRTSKQIINREFARLFDNFMNITNPNEEGVIDQSEVGLLANNKGFFGILRYEKDNNEDIKEILIKEMKTSIFAGLDYSCKYLGLSITDKNNLNELLQSFNIEVDHFIGFNNDYNLIVINGIELNNKSIKTFQQKLLESEQPKTSSKNKAPLELAIEKIEKTNKLKPKEAAIEDINDVVSKDDFWNEILNM